MQTLEDKAETLDRKLSSLLTELYGLCVQEGYHLTAVDVLKATNELKGSLIELAQGNR